MYSSTNLSSSEVTRLCQNYSLSGFDLLERIQKMNHDELINTVIEIIKMNPPQKRKISDIICIKHAVKDMPFFQQLIEEKGSDSTKQFLKNMLYSFFKKEEILFNQGDVVDRFYVLLSGKVSIIVNHTETQINQKGEEQQIVVTEEIKIIESGHSIGDIALLRDQKRNSGIICKEDSHFLVLEKEDFNKIIADMEEREVQNKINFLKTLIIFESFSRRQLEISMIYLNKLKVRKGFLLCEEDKISAYIYIIIKGEFKVSKSINFERQPNPFSKAVIAQKDQIEEMKERKVKKVLEIATLSEGEICCDIDALDDNPQLFTIECTSQKAEIFQIKTQHFLKRIVNEYYDKSAYKKIIIEKINWRLLRLKKIQKIIQGHSELLSGVYPKKNLVYYHADQEPIELVRRDSKQLDFYDREQEIKQIKQRLSKYKRSKSGDTNQINEIQFLNMPKAEIHGNLDNQFLPEVRSRVTSNNGQNQHILSSQNNTFSPIKKQIKYQSQTQSPQIICQYQKQLCCVQRNEEFQLIRNQNNLQKQNNLCLLSNSQQIKQNEQKQLNNYANLLALLDQNKQQQIQNSNNIVINSQNDKNDNNLNLDLQINQSKDALNQLNIEQNKKIFSNQKLQEYCIQKQKSLYKEITINDKGNDAQKQIFLNQVQDYQIDEPNIYKRVSCLKSSSFSFASSSSFGDNCQQLEMEKSSDTLIKNQQLNIKDLNKTYNRFKFTSEGLAECPKQIDTKYVQFYKHNLIEDFNVQSDNYQEYYQRHYILPKQLYLNDNSYNKNAKERFQNNQIAIQSQTNYKNQFDQMYSSISQNRQKNKILSDDCNSLQQFNKKDVTFNNQTTKVLPSKCYTEENSPRSNSQKQNIRQKQSNQTFIYPEQEGQDQSTFQKSSLRNQLIKSNDEEIIEKHLQKKMQICIEQEKKITSHLKNYKIDESNLPVSVEENQAISDSLMRLLKTKFGKNQQKITTTDWRYNSSLIFTQENDISYSAENKKQQQMLVARQRKDMIALKQRINLKQSAASSQLSSPTESRKRFSQSINYDDKANQTSKDQDIQNILQQIKDYNKKKFVNQIQQEDQAQDDKNSQLSKKVNSFNFKELKNQTLYSDVNSNINQQNAQICRDNSIQFEQYQSIQRPQTTQIKVKQIIPNKTCNTEWRIFNHLKIQKQQEKQTTEPVQKSIDQTFQVNNDNKEQSILESDEILPSKSFQLIDKLSRAQMDNQEKQLKSQIAIIEQKEQEHRKYPNSTLENKPDSNFQANQTVINNKKFMPYLTRRQTKLQSPFQSPTRPRRIVNIRVNFQGSGLKQKLYQSFQEQSNQNSQTKKQTFEQTNSNEKSQLLKDFSSEIKITSIKSIEKTHELSQVEVWDSRCYNSNQEFNQTFYQYNSPLQHQKAMNKLTKNKHLI
ncbi:hypothetical protein ABPG72_012767 [Tetrahymena utriculariae]